MYMRSLVQEKEQAISLRKKGQTYKEILDIVKVSKSSLSSWLKDLPLTKDEKSYLRSRTDSNISRGRINTASSLRNRRLAREKVQYQEAKLTFHKNITDPLFFVGVSLYWAEGGKRTSQWQFVNSDENMQKVMLKWLEKFIKIETRDVFFRLYVHKAYRDSGYEKWWAKTLGVSERQLLKTIIKPSGLGIKKRPNYKGCLRLEVRSSKALLNKMRFWEQMLVEYYTA